jgi:hypothetical protein
MSLRFSWGLASVAAVAAVAALGFVPSAGADVIAAVDVPVGTSPQCGPAQWDIALMNAATGARSSLPSGINTSQNELHPSISALGTRLVFSRVDPVGGTTQIVAADLGTGVQAQLYNVFDATTLGPSTPSLSPDAGTVLAGAPFAPAANSQFTPVENLTSLANFPNGPFTHSTRGTNVTLLTQGTTGDPVERSDGLIAASVGSKSGSGGTPVDDIVIDMGGGNFKLGSDNFMSFPAFSDPTTNVLVFQHEVTNQVDGTHAHIGFRPVNTFDTSPSTDLPAAVNIKDADALHPAFTPDGRYLGFVSFAHGGDRHIRLFVFDTQTQTMLNSSGIDLGNLESFGCKSSGLWSGFGGLSLRETFLLLRSSVSFGLPSANSLVSFVLASSTGVGILVQRVVGHHRLFGHVVPLLQTVGRVPFGQFARGRHKVHWDLRVGGHRLRKGTYLITPRLVSRGGTVHELGTPRLVRIR